jgi:ISXO2-like transposase domain
VAAKSGFDRFSNTIWRAVSGLQPVLIAACVESYFALLRRGLTGSFHHVSKKHFGRYCDELSFRWDYRKTTDGEHTVEAIKGGEGKRLMYRQPIKKSPV